MILKCNVFFSSQFRISRLFWSTSGSKKLCKYTCSVEEKVKEDTETKKVEEETLNMGGETICHDTEISHLTSEHQCLDGVKKQRRRRTSSSSSTDNGTIICSDDRLSVIIKKTDRGTSSRTKKRKLDKDDSLNSSTSCPDKSVRGASFSTVSLSAKNLLKKRQTSRPGSEVRSERSDKSVVHGYDHTTNSFRKMFEISSNSPPNSSYFRKDGFIVHANDDIAIIDARKGIYEAARRPVVDDTLLVHQRQCQAQQPLIRNAVASKTGFAVPMNVGNVTPVNYVLNNKTAVVSNPTHSLTSSTKYSTLLPKSTLNESHPVSTLCTSPEIAHQMKKYSPIKPKLSPPDQLNCYSYPIFSSRSLPTVRNNEIRVDSKFSSGSLKQQISFEDPKCNERGIYSARTQFYTAPFPSAQILYTEDSNRGPRQPTLPRSEYCLSTIGSASSQFLHPRSERPESQGSKQILLGPFVRTSHSERQIKQHTLPHRTKSVSPDSPLNNSNSLQQLSISNNDVEYYSHAAQQLCSVLATNPQLLDYLGTTDLRGLHNELNLTGVSGDLSTVSERSQLYCYSANIPDSVWSELLLSSSGNVQNTSSVASRDREHHLTKTEHPDKTHLAGLGERTSQSSIHCGNVHAEIPRADLLPDKNTNRIQSVSLESHTTESHALTISPSLDEIRAHDAVRRSDTAPQPSTCATSCSNPTSKATIVKDSGNSCGNRSDELRTSPKLSSKSPKKSHCSSGNISRIRPTKRNKKWYVQKMDEKVKERLKMQQGSKPVSWLNFIFKNEEGWRVESTSLEGKKRFLRQLLCCNFMFFSKLCIDRSETVLYICESFVPVR